MARTDRSRSPALAYLRTSSAANVGTDKDSDRRQRQAIQGFAKRAGFALVDEFYDAAVSGADPSRHGRASRRSLTASRATAWGLLSFVDGDQSEMTKAIR